MKDNHTVHYSLRQKLLYEHYLKIYGDPRYRIIDHMDCSFFLKPGFSDMDFQLEKDFRKRNTMIDESWERWYLWVRLQKKCKRLFFSKKPDAEKKLYHTQLQLRHSASEYEALLAFFQKKNIPV